MTPVAKTLSLAVVTLGLALGAPSTAMAGAGFQNSSSTAWPEGASLTVTHSYVGDDGRTSYEHVTYTATIEGASVKRTTSTAK